MVHFKLIIITVTHLSHTEHDTKGACAEPEEMCKTYKVIFSDL